MASDSLVREMRERVVALERENADLLRHNGELREAIAALLAPDKPVSDVPKMVYDGFGNDKASVFNG